MKIVIFGANGLTGKELVKQALENRHNVTALVRNPDSIKIKHENLAVKQANILDVNSFENIFEGKDVIISAVGTGASIKKARKATTIYSEGYKHIVTAMRKHGIKRFIALLSVGTIPDPNEAAIHRVMIRPMLKGTYDDMRRAENFLAICNNIDWIGIRPLRLNNNPKTGKYRTGIDFLPEKGINISRADVADLMLKLMSSDKNIRKYVTIAN